MMKGLTISFVLCSLYLCRASNVLTGFGNGVRPADGIQIANNQPFYFQELSNTRPQPPQAVDDNNDHNPNNNNQIHHKDKAKHKLMQMLKMGIMFDMFENYREDVDYMLRRKEDIVDSLKQTQHNKAILPREEYMLHALNGSFIMGAGHGVSGSNSCRKIYISGTNKYEMVEAGAGAPFLFDGRLTEKGLVGPEVVRRVMEDARDQDLDFIRVNAFAVDNQFSAIVSYESGDLILNENILRGLDFVVDQARLHGLKVLLVLTDYFSDRSGGPLEYMQLAGSAGKNLTSDQIIQAKSNFYTDVTATSIFKMYVKAITQRQNFYNARTYSEDPTILGWDIMNEPRCGSQTVICQPDDRIYTFVSDMVSYLKTDPTIGVKQLVTVGTEGFFSTGEFAGIYKGPSQSGVNPYYEEGASLADFGTLCALVDFCEFNIYPDLYHQENPGWVEAWVEAHSVVAVKLQKPVIVKEQGMQPTSKRKEFFKIMYETELGQILNDRDLDGGLKGVAYWEAFARGTEAVFWTKSDGGRWGIYPFDPEIKSIKALSKELRQLNGIKFPCPSVNMEPALTQPVKVPPPPQCPQGYHGIGCEDIDECVLGLHDCSINAACINNPGSYKCECYKGWHGNGRICVSMPISQFHILTAFYTNDSLSCISTSEDVEYPVTAPGYVEDPTGYFPPHSATSRIPTSLTECKIACLMAGECTSFYFDPIQGQCILKKNECPYTQATIPGCDPSTCGRTPRCYSPNETSCTMVVYHDGSSAPNPAVATYPCTRGITYFLKEANFINDKCVPPTH